MKTQDKKVCETANCDWYRVNKTYPTGYCSLNHKPLSCCEAKESPLYAEFREKRLSKYFSQCYVQLRMSKGVKL